jgi:hypothetical protein
MNTAENNRLGTAPKVLGASIERLCEAHVRWLEKELAELSRHTMSLIECARIEDPKPIMVCQIAHALGTTTQDLWTAR